MKTARSSTIRASEIGSFLYCRRAWWYQQTGHQSRNQGEMLSGTRIHESHGRSVFVAGLYRWIGYALLLLALVLGAVHLLTNLL